MGYITPMDGLSVTKENQFRRTGPAGHQHTPAMPSLVAQFSNRQTVSPLSFSEHQTLPYSCTCPGQRFNHSSIYRFNSQFPTNNYPLTTNNFIGFTTAFTGFLPFFNPSKSLRTRNLCKFTGFYRYFFFDPGGGGPVKARETSCERFLKGFCDLENFGYEPLAKIERF
jgi:hypothetical protein